MSDRLKTLCFECHAELSDVNDTGICEDCRALLCENCATMTEWIDCYNCEDGFSHHECGEDSCCCLQPEPNVPCDICDGKGGWRACPSCHPNAFNDR